MWRVTLKNLWSRKLRLLSTSVAVLLGVAFVSGSLVLSSTINTMFDGLFADVYENIDVVARGEEPEFGGERVKIDASLVDTVRGVDGVAKVNASFAGPAQLIGQDGKVVGGNGPPALGMAWLDDPDLNPYGIAEGRAPQSSSELVADAGTVERGKVSLNETVRVLTVDGIQDMRLVGIAKFGELDNAGGTNFLFFTPDDAARLVGTPGKIDSIDVVAREGVSAEALRNRVAAVMPPGTETLTGDEVSEQDANALKKGLSFIGIIPLVFAGISLFVGAFIINNTFAILVAQRSREMALLRAIGAGRRQVMTSVVLESLVVGLIASIVGLFAGLAVAAGLLAALRSFGVDFPDTSLPLEASTVAIALVAGVGVTVVAAFLPARRASRIPPIAALRDVAIEPTRASVARLVTGALLVLVGLAALAAGLFVEMDRPYIPVGAGAALTFIGVYVLGPAFARPLSAVLGWPLAKLRGTTGVLARQNAMRNPRRTSSTAAALMIGVTLVTVVSVFTASAKASVNRVIDSSLRGDFIVTGPSAQGLGVGLTPALGDSIEALPETDKVVRLTDVNPVVNGELTFATALDPASLLGVMDVSTASGRLTDVDRSSFAVYKDVAENKDWQVGDSAEFVFADGSRETLRLAAVYEDQSFLAPYLVSHSTYLAHTARPTDSLLLIAKTENTQAEDARRAVESLTTPYPNATLQDQTQFKDDIAGTIDQVLNVFLVLLALAVVIALLGIANTLALSVFERTRELGLLRAVGMTRRQVRSMIRWESVILALFGAMLGLLIGTLFGMALVAALRDQGIEVLAIPVPRLAAMTAVAVLAGVIAAIVPARRAARLDILKAIATE